MDVSLVEMYKHLVVYVLETAMNETEHGVRLLDFVRQMFGIVLHFATLNRSFHLSDNVNLSMSFWGVIGLVLVGKSEAHFGVISE